MLLFPKEGKKINKSTYKQRIQGFLLYKKIHLSDDGVNKYKNED